MAWISSKWPCRIFYANRRILQQTSGLILGQAQIIANHPIMARDIEGSPDGDVLSIEGSPDVDIFYANCIVEMSDFILYYL